MEDTHKLLTGAFNLSNLWDLGHVTLFTFLRGVEPPADTKSRPSVLTATYDDLLNGVEAFTRLYLEKYKLVPAGRDGF